MEWIVCDRCDFRIAVSDMQMDEIENHMDENYYECEGTLRIVEEDDN